MTVIKHGVLQYTIYAVSIAAKMCKHEVCFLQEDCAIYPAVRFFCLKTMKFIVSSLCCFAPVGVQYVSILTAVAYVI